MRVGNRTEEVLQVDIIKDSSNQLTTPKEIEESLRLIEDLKFFLATAPVNWQENQIIRRYYLNNDQGFVSCVFWNNLYYITGTDIVKCCMYRMQKFGRDIIYKKKFEEGIFSDLRNLKCGVDATLEQPKSEFLSFLFKNMCLKTQKKQKVFFWFSVPHDKLFADALERDLKREGLNQQSTTKPVNEPSLSFTYDINSSKTLFDQVSDHVQSQRFSTTNSTLNSSSADLLDMIPVETTATTTTTATINNDQLENKNSNKNLNLIKQEQDQTSINSNQENTSQIGIDTSMTNTQNNNDSISPPTRPPSTQDSGMYQTMELEEEVSTDLNSTKNDKNDFPLDYFPVEIEYPEENNVHNQGFDGFYNPNTNNNNPNTNLNNNPNGNLNFPPDNFSLPSNMLYDNAMPALFDEQSIVSPANSNFKPYNYPLVQQPTHQIPLSATRSHMFSYQDPYNNNNSSSNNSNSNINNSNNNNLNNNNSNNNLSNPNNNPNSNMNNPNNSVNQNLRSLKTPQQRTHNINYLQPHPSHRKINESISRKNSIDDSNISVPENTSYKPQVLTIEEPTFPLQQQLNSAYPKQYSSNPYNPSTGYPNIYPNQNYNSMNLNPPVMDFQYQDRNFSGNVYPTGGYDELFPFQDNYDKDYFNIQAENVNWSFMPTQAMQPATNNFANPYHLPYRNTPMSARNSYMMAAGSMWGQPPPPNPNNMMNLGSPYTLNQPASSTNKQFPQNNSSTATTSSNNNQANIYSSQRRRGKYTSNGLHQQIHKSHKITKPSSIQRASSQSSNKEKSIYSNNYKSVSISTSTNRQINPIVENSSSTKNDHTLPVHNKGSTTVSQLNIQPTVDEALLPNDSS
ncbi:hypothetical protein TBLA_0A03270 [Henningerozyma blattae CBS 6284]|uniref:Uncharacterized protein n=1 Tax=Henningerozyma blattae (strain ATCC 34711 / CBS 6284 / DSM 70876 / NBRC 10599 / NRRL Y-10934 / UCD 77-7) TaxID=1071380 RepID=I2GVH5_HENB6|nr:hypothetical protein TBLA_0A03270 [Tetrapisispora blattae CBS 6284]CCH58127.1 hypothetical protein TBLA_0A03270 [Tetrapisispora blattae CBS 6284]